MLEFAESEIHYCLPHPTLHTSNIVVTSLIRKNVSLLFVVITWREANWSSQQNICPFWCLSIICIQSKKKKKNPWIWSKSLSIKLIAIWTLKLILNNKYLQIAHYNLLCPPMDLFNKVSSYAFLFGFDFPLRIA